MKPIEQEPIEQEPMEQESIEQEPMEQEPMEQEPMEQEPMEPFINQTLISIIPTKYKSFKDVKNIIADIYDDDTKMQSTALDIISLYLKGQKTLYTESKVYCEYYLYRLMLPTIFLSIASSVISGNASDYEYSSFIVSIMTAFNSFVLTIITYLKLDAKAEAHKTTAYSFEKLESSCEFNSGKILLSNNIQDVNYISEYLSNIESQIQEIKEKNQFMIPEDVRFRFKNIYSINIFSEIKKIRTDELVLINRLKVTMNEQVDIQKEIDSGRYSHQELIIMKEKQIQRYEERNNYINRIIQYRKEYDKISDMFINEININIDRSKVFFECCKCLKT
jgi:hypothetical protein